MPRAKNVVCDVTTLEEIYQKYKDVIDTEILKGARHAILDWNDELDVRHPWNIAAFDDEAYRDYLYNLEFICTENEEYEPERDVVEDYLKTIWINVLVTKDVVKFKRIIGDLEKG